MDKFGADKQRTGRGSKFARSAQWPNDADRGVSRKKNRRAGTLSTATWLVVVSEQPEQHKGDLRRRIRSSEPIQEVGESDESVVILCWAFDSRGGAADVGTGTSHFF